MRGSTESPDEAAARDGPHEQGQASQVHVERRQ